MKAILIPVFTLLIGYTYSILNNPPAEPISGNQVVVDTSGFDQEKALKELRESIKGKEDLPSVKVWKNVQMYTQLPAGRLLGIMELGYSRSLGVTCIHCHNTEDYASDEKKEKLITREMAQMVGKINSELLANIEELSDRRAIVNCTTCHRGQKKPALFMEDEEK